MAYDTKTHEDAVCAVVARERANRPGFMKFLRKLLAETWYEYEDIGRIVPDAWRWDADRRTMVVWEITNTSPVKGDKLAKYGELWFHLDCDCVDLEVYEVQAVAGLPTAQIDLSLTHYEDLGDAIGVNLSVPQFTPMPEDHDSVRRMRDAISRVDGVAAVGFEEVIGHGIIRITVTGGDDQRVGQALWDSLLTGTITAGTVAVVVDAPGFSDGVRSVAFNRPQ